MDYLPFILIFFAAGIGTLSVMIALAADPAPPKPRSRKKRRPF